MADQYILTVSVSWAYKWGRSGSTDKPVINQWLFSVRQCGELAELINMRNSCTFALLFPSKPYLKVLPQSSHILLWTPQTPEVQTDDHKVCGCLNGCALSLELSQPPPKGHVPILLCSHKSNEKTVFSHRRIVLSRGYFYKLSFRWALSGVV